MGKARRGHKELSKEQQLKQENQKLRRDLSFLRKQLARVDLDRYGQVSKIVHDHYHEMDKQESQESTQEMLNSMKETWKCHECNSGYLEINIYSRLDGCFYYRACNNCSNRTKSQKYDENTVEGIIKQPVKKLTK